MESILPVQNITKK